MKKMTIFFCFFIITNAIIYYLITRKETIDHVINVFRQRHPLSGVILAAHDDTIIYYKAFGNADYCKNYSNTHDSKFLLASITKQITAAAILLLVDKKLIDLNKPVSAYLTQKSSFWKNEEVPAWANKITIHHLLTHSSGLPEYVTLPEFSDFYSQPRSVAEILQFFSYHPVKFTAGEKYEYSGSGYNLLGAIIEEVSKKSYSNFLKENFFDPLDLKDIYAPDKQLLSAIQKEDPALSKGYNYDSKTKKIEPAGLVNLSTAFSEASIIASAGNLYSWLSALYEGKIISKELVTKMTSDYFLVEDNLSIGYGVYKDTSEGMLVYVHTGRINGYESIYLYNPNHKIFVIILSNIQGSNIYPLAYEILKTQTNLV